MASPAVKDTAGLDCVYSPIQEHGSCHASRECARADEMATAPCGRLAMTTSMANVMASPGP
jgi:hypothetical protein